MKESVKLIFLAIFSISISCSAHTFNQQYNKQLAIGDTIDDVMQYGYVSVSAIKKMIQSNYGENISNFKISKQYVADCHLYWYWRPGYRQISGYRDGSKVIINDTCIVVSFTTTTYNDDGTERYKDDYSYLFPSHDNIIIYHNMHLYQNMYNGVGHEQSTKIYKNENDARFSGIDDIFINTKIPLLIRLEGIINKRK